MEDIFVVPRNCLHFANATIHCAAQVDDSSKTKQNKTQKTDMASMCLKQK